MPVTPRQARQVAASLRACGLQRHASREFLSLSYGQKRLALLARALVQDPDWLLLDELYNGLDAAYRRRIDAVLAAAARRGQSWVATAHRAADVPRGTRDLLELAEGRVQAVKRLRASDLVRLAQRAGERPRARAGARRGAPRKQQRHGRRQRVRCSCVCRTSICTSSIGPCCAISIGHLRKGEHWAVYGANGAGKSSFLKLLYGDLSPAVGGRIERAGCPRGTPIAEWKRRTGYVSPELQSDYAVDVSSSGSGGERPIRQHRSRRCGDGGGSPRGGALAQVLRSAGRSPSAGRASCRMGSCAARSLRARWRPMRASCCWMSR